MLPMLCLYAAMLVIEPSIRPRIVEALAGVMMAATADRLIRGYWIAYLNEVTESCVKRPDMKYLACIVNYPFYAENGGLYYFVWAAAFFGGFFIATALSMLVQAASASYPLRFLARDGGPLASMNPITLVYFGALMTITYRRTLRWYAGLPVQR